MRIQPDRRIRDAGGVRAGDPVWVCDMLAQQLRVAADAYERRDDAALREALSLGLGLLIRGRAPFWHRPQRR